MCGCVNTSFQTTNSNNGVIDTLLRQKYSEDFEILSVRYQGTVGYAMCSPVNDPEVIFEARFSSGVLNEDTYVECKKAKEINDIFKEDLRDLFPNAYFRTYYLKTGLYLDIYISKTVGTPKLYNREYRYFTDQVNKYIEDGTMQEVTVTFYKVDNESIEKISEYFKKNSVEKNDFYTNALGIDSFQVGNNNDFLGKPTQISACFKKGMPSYLDDEKEYIRRRELFENE